MFSYSQSTGIFSKDDERIADGYSGNGEFMNRPEAQNVGTHGPIPRGRYTICQPTVHEQLGPIAMELMPYPTNEMFLRSGFFIHGDNKLGNQSASEGCIILPRDVRTNVAAAVLAGDNQLTVTE